MRPRCARCAAALPRCAVNARNADLYLGLPGASRQMEAQRRARRLAVPTRDLDVRNMLRGLGHPVTLFAENVRRHAAPLRAALPRECS